MLGSVTLCNILVYIGKYLFYIFVSWQCIISFWWSNIIKLLTRCFVFVFVDKQNLFAVQCLFSSPDPNIDVNYCLHWVSGSIESKTYWLCLLHGPLQSFCFLFQWEIQHGVSDWLNFKILLILLLDILECDIIGMFIRWFCPDFAVSDLQSTQSYI